MKKQRNAVSFLVTVESIALIAALVFAFMNPLKSKENQKETIVSGGTENSIGKNTQSTEIDDSGEVVVQETQTEETQDSEAEPEVIEERLTFSEKVEEKLNTMTAEEMAAQMFIVTPEALTGVAQVTASGNTTKAAYEKYPVAGIVYSEKNFQNQNQSKLMLSRMQQIATNRIGFSLFMGKSEEWDPNSETAKKWTESYQPNQMISIVKILSKDVSDGSVQSKLEQIKPGELLMCQDMKTAVAVRENLNYNGVLLTDSCTSLTGEDVQTSSVNAIKAGVDLIYLPGDFTAAYEGVVNAMRTGEISSDRIHNAVGRILTAKEDM